MIFAVEKRCNLTRQVLYITNLTMAIAIKAIPTLYGEDAVRFREAIEQADREFDARPQRDITKDARYIMMKNVLRKARI